VALLEPLLDEVPVVLREAGMVEGRPVERRFAERVVLEVLRFGMEIVVAASPIGISRSAISSLAFFAA